MENGGRARLQYESQDSPVERVETPRTYSEHERSECRAPIGHVPYRWVTLPTALKKPRPADDAPAPN